MAEIFIDSTWMLPLFGVLLYISDYTLTIVCARMYKSQNVIEFEGSFEITPGFQKDIDALKIISSRFIMALCVWTIIIYTLQQLYLQSEDGSWYLFAIGAMIMLELAVHVRHLRNWFLFGHGLGAEGVQGHVKYPRQLLLRMSSFEILVFAGVFTVLYFLTINWLFLGGATSCTIIAFRHYRLAKNYKVEKTSAA
jgi:hypothetical protein